MNNSKKKVALRTLLIIGIVSVIAFLGLLVGHAVATDVSDLLPALKRIVKGFLGAYMYPFAADHAYAKLFAMPYEALGQNPLIFSIVVLALSGVALILIVLGIVLCASRKRPGFIFYAIMLLAFVGVQGVGLSFGPVLFVEINNYIAKDPDITVAMALLALLALVFGTLAFIIILVTYFVGLGEVAKKEDEVGDTPETKVVTFDEQQPVLPEDNSQPESVVEGTQDQTAQVYGDDYIPTVEPEPEPDPIPEVAEEAIPVEPEPIPEPQSEETNNHVEVNVNNQAPQQPQGIDPNSLAALLRDVVRDIVRDEIARNNVNQPKVNEDKNGNQTVTGATFGGPLVVQYFNGGINGVTPTPAPAPAPVEEKKEEPAPAKEEPKPEPQPEPAKEEPAPAPAPAPVEEAVEPLPIATPVEEKKPEKVYERLSFAERLLQSDKELLDLYNDLKNEILSYGVKSRISAVGDTFRLHKKMYVRITVAGKSLKLYFALDPEDYKDSKIPVQDAGHKGLYAEIPLVFKVRSGLSVRRCKELIQDCMEKDGLEQGEVGKVNWVKELKAEMAADKKKEKEEE